MNAKKIIFIIVLLIIIAGIGYFIYSSFETKSNKAYIYLLNINDKDKITKAITDEVEKKYISNNEDFEIEIISYQTNHNLSFKAPQGIVSQNKFKEIAIPKLSDFFADYQNTISDNNTVNTVLESLIQQMSSVKELSSFYVFGSFTDCYDTTSANIVLGQLKQFIKDEQKKNIHLFWNIETSVGEPEQIITDYFAQNNFHFEKDLFIVPERVCNDYKNVELVFLSDIEEKEKENIIALFQDTYNDKIFLKINSTNSQYDRVKTDLMVLDSIINNFKFYNNKTFIEARMLMMQTLNYWENTDTNSQGDIYFIGNLPKPKKSDINNLKVKNGGLLSSKEQLLNLKRNENLKFYFNLSSSIDSFDPNQEFYDYFHKRSDINAEILKF